jgi:hypothetical protein
MIKLTNSLPVQLIDIEKNAFSSMCTPKGTNLVLSHSTGLAHFPNPILHLQSLLEMKLPELSSIYLSIRSNTIHARLVNFCLSSLGSNLTCM